MYSSTMPEDKKGEVRNIKEGEQEELLLAAPFY
jgi:hypothetical protein